MKKMIYLLFTVFSTVVFFGCTVNSPGIEKAITDYGFEGLEDEVFVDIDGTEITVTLPYGTDVNTLIPFFETTGVSVLIDGVEQISGTTVNDFSNPVTYTVIAEDGTSIEYTITVIIALNPAKDITAFIFPEDLNSSELSADVTADIDDSVITVKVPYISDVADLLDSLVAEFTTTGSRVAVDGTVQNSGITSNDYASTVEYKVTAEDGSEKVYDVNVLITVTRAQLTGMVNEMVDDVGNIKNISHYITRTDTSNITDMSFLFVETDFDEDISEWDVSNVTDMSNMFSTNSFDQDIGSWDVSSVLDMDEMFYNAASFDQDLSDWGVNSLVSHDAFETGSALTSEYMPPFPMVPLP